MDQTEFLGYVLGDAPGYIEVAPAAVLATAAGTPEGTWVEYPLREPLQRDDLVFRPVVVPEPGYDLRRNGITTRVVGATTPPEVPTSLPPSLRVLVDSGRIEAYWQLSEPVPYHEVEDLRHRLDPLGQPSPYLALPGVISSDLVPPHLVEVESSPTLRAWRLGEVKRLDPPLSAPLINATDVYWEPLADDGAVVGPQTYLAARLDGDDAQRIGRMVERPNTPFGRLIVALLESGLTFAECAWLAFKARSNPYAERRWTARWETAKHVARLAATLHTPGAQMVRQINSLRKKTGTAFARRADVNEAIHADMSRRGRFVHAIDKTYWYIDRMTGEAIQLTTHTERLGIFIAYNYGINAADPDARYVVQHLITQTGVLPRQGEVTALSFYRDDPDPSRRQLFVHFGGREIGLLTVDGLSSDPNGNSGLVFQLPSESDPVVTTGLRTDSPLSWWDTFLPPEYFRSLDAVDPVHASVLMRIWLQFVMFRQAARTRPILAFLGTIGSGKSTAARRFYTLLYGGRKELTTVDSAREYDTLTSNNPFVVFDNLDSCPNWLPTRLEMSITPREQDRRKLFTDNTLYHIKCDAIVGLTAHDASIFREGVIDRMLVLTFRRLSDDEKLPEGELYREVVERREEFLSGVLSDALRILRTPKIPFREQGWTTSIRVVDFVDTGYWFADALGCLPEFKDAVATLKRRQTGLVVEGEGTLVEALIAFADSSHADEWLSSASLWNHLCSVAPDPQLFQTLYRTPAVLGGKLGSIYAQLKDAIGLTFMEEPRSGRKLWKISPNEEEK